MLPKSRGVSRKGCNGDVVTNGVGMKRLNGVDALMLYSETPEIHMHTLKIGVLDVSGVEGGYSFDLFRQWRSPAAGDGTASSSARRNSAEDAPSDVGGERRHRLRLSRSPSAGARPRRPPGTGPIDR